MTDAERIEQLERQLLLVQSQRDYLVGYIEGVTGAPYTGYGRAASSYDPNDPDDPGNWADDDPRWETAVFALTDLGRGVLAGRRAETRPAPGASERGGE